MHVGFFFPLLKDKQVRPAPIPVLRNRHHRILKHARLKCNHGTTVGCEYHHVSVPNANGVSELQKHGGHQDSGSTGHLNLCSSLRYAFCVSIRFNRDANLRAFECVF